MQDFVQLDIHVYNKRGIRNFIFIVFVFMCYGLPI